MDAKELNRMLTERAESVCRMLFPNGKSRGREFSVGSINGEPGESLKVSISGSKQGVWSDFASGGDMKGDMLDLWRLARGLSISDAIREVKSYLGVSDPVLTVPKKREYRKPKQPSGAKKCAPDSPVTVYLTTERCLDPAVIRKYMVGSLDNVGPFKNWERQQPIPGPWIVLPFMRDNELIGVKYLHVNRRDGKKFTLVEPDCAPTLFGWHAIPDDARTVVLCEGEIDALSLYQYGHPAMSVPFGGGKGDKQQWVDYDWEHLERFDTIYLCMDNDDEGRAAVTELINRLGQHRCMIVTLPQKDANECLQKGVTVEEINECFENAKSVSPDELKPANHFYSQVLDEFYPAGGELPGCKTPWVNVPFRFLRGEVSVVTGVNGHGKSLMWGYIMLHAMRQGERACVASLEMRPAKTLHRMVRQATALRRPPHYEIKACLDWMTDRLWLFDLVGTGKVDRLLEVFTYAHRRYGINHAIIDSMLKCGIGEDEYNKQKELMEKLCDFSNRTGVHVHLVCHPRKADDETPAGKMDVKGTGALTDLAFNVFSVYRNKHKESQVNTYRESGQLPKGCQSEEELFSQADAVLFIHKARNVEECEGFYKLYFDRDSWQYLRGATEPPCILWGDDAGEQAPF